jgi:hypothetical protein
MPPHRDRGCRDAATPPRARALRCRSPRARVRARRRPQRLQRHAYGRARPFVSEPDRSRVRRRIDLLDPGMADLRRRCTTGLRNGGNGRNLHIERRIGTSPEPGRNDNSAARTGRAIAMRWNIACPCGASHAERHERPTVTVGYGAPPAVYVAACRNSNRTTEKNRICCRPRRSFDMARLPSAKSRPPSKRLLRLHYPATCSPHPSVLPVSTCYPAPGDCFPVVVGSELSYRRMQRRPQVLRRVLRDSEPERIRITGTPVCGVSASRQPTHGRARCQW